MRKLKFRFWLKNKKQGILELEQGGIIDMPWEWDKVDQFTGLLDKQGKEIYEGDIVRNDRGFLYEVEYVLPYGAFLQRRVDEKEVLAPMNFNLQEVIGNIYENPELLEVK